MYTILALLVLCNNTIGKSTNTSIDFSTIYKKYTNGIFPQFLVYHCSDSISELHFSINTKQLLYTKQLNEDAFSAQVRIAYCVMPSYESTKIIDSASIKLIDHDNNQYKQLTGYIPFRSQYGSSCLLEITVTDLKKNITTKHYLKSDKSNRLGRENFMVRSGDKQPIFNNYLNANEKVTITCNNPTKKVMVNYYARPFPIANPPFAMSENTHFDYIPDSSYVILLENHLTFSISLTKAGMYHVRTDTSQREGLTLFCKSIYFPEVRTTSDLFPPLRYITTNDEFDEISVEKNKKTAVDNFWLTLTGNREKAKEMIRKFYTRVEEANVFFSSYINGWQTDRGMIYIIYGPPNIIEKTTYAERWIYGEESNAMSLSFTFVQVINPFTDNDYALERSPLFKSHWYRGVDVWRQGRVY